MIFIFQVQSLTGSSIPFFSPLEASTPKCFRQQVPWTLSYSHQERYQLSARPEHKRAACQQRQQVPWTITVVKNVISPPHPPG